MVYFFGHPVCLYSIKSFAVKAKLFHSIQGHTGGKQHDNNINRKFQAGYNVHIPECCKFISWNIQNKKLTQALFTLCECFKGDEASQWKRPKFDTSPHQNPLTDLHKNWQA